MIPEIAISENYDSQQSENITAEGHNQQPTTIDEYVNPNFDSENIAITSEIASEENTQPDNSPNIISENISQTTAQPPSRAASTNATTHQPKTTSTSTGDSKSGTSSTTTELPQNTTSNTSKYNRFKFYFFLFGGAESFTTGKI